MATATTAQLSLNAKGAAEVLAYFRLTPDTYVACYTYSDQAPILTLDDGPARVMITTTGRDATEADLDQAHRLADAVDRYVTEMEIRLNKQVKAAPEAA
jgi:hypothetical protein